MKHTPGPWKAEIKPSMGRLMIHGFDNNAVCKMASVRSLEENKANACLIVAAPELLEACKNLENDNNAIPKHAWDMIQQAIAKAEGGE